MGYRADFVIVERNGWRLYHGRNGALSLASLLVRGPCAARHEIAKLPRAADGDRHDTGAWYSDSFAEGGAVLDVTRGRLLFYGTDGGMFDTPEIRVFRELLRRIWRDWHWKVRWAYDGQGDLVAALGLDRSVVRARCEPATPYVVEDPAEADQGIHLLTIRTDEGGIRAWPCHDDDPAGHTGWQGPALLGRPPRALDGHGAAVASEGAARLTLAGIPVSGTHVDVPERTVGVWTGATCEALLPALADRWRGWRTEFWGDRYEQQLLACEDAVTVPAFDAAAALENVLSHLPAGRGTPMRAGIEAARNDTSPYGYKARSTPALEQCEPDEERDWYWAGRAAGYLLRDLGREHTDPDTPPWQRRVRPAPALPDFLRARLDDADRAAQGAARLENNRRGIEYWFRARFHEPSPQYGTDVEHWPDWEVRVARSRTGRGPGSSPEGRFRPDPFDGNPFDHDFLTVGPYRLRPVSVAGAAVYRDARDRLFEDAALAGEHLARHSPARARTDLAARRRLLNRYDRAAAEVDRLRREGATGTPAMAAALTRRHTLYLTLRDLAAAFANHPDHNPEWHLPAGVPYRT